MSKKEKIVLNEQQKQVYEEIKKYIAGKEPYAYLIIEGYAGTGKTTVLGMFIKEKIKEGNDILVGMTAPTNKAVKVLKQHSGIRSSKLSFITIHKLLGLKPQITDRGEQVFVADLFEHNEIEGYDLIVIDEASMLADELFKELHKHKKKVIFMGDPAQIPPINETDSIPMRSLLQDTYKIHPVRMTEIMRQAADNPIIKASFHIRENIDKREIDFSQMEQGLDEQGHGVEILSSANKEHRAKMISEIERIFCSKAFKEDANHGKVIAWTNALVDKMNIFIRKKIYASDTLPKIVPGEKLFADSPIMETLQFGKKVIFNTNDEFEVVSYDMIDYKGFQCYRTLVRYSEVDGEEKQQTIKIIHESNEARYRNMLRGIASDAKSTYRNKRGSAAAKWKYYYAVKEWFAEINYSYAITGHKSQGSTYVNTMVLAYDIMKNPKIIERNRILYTAFTRPQQKLIIITQ